MTTRASDHHPTLPKVGDTVEWTGLYGDADSGEVVAVDGSHATVSVGVWDDRFEVSVADFLSGAVRVRGTR